MGKGPVTSRDGYGEGVLALPWHGVPLRDTFFYGPAKRPEERGEQRTERPSGTVAPPQGAMNLAPTPPWSSLRPAFFPHLFPKVSGREHSRPYWLAGHLLPKKPASESSGAANNETLTTGGHWHLSILPTLLSQLVLRTQARCKEKGPLPSSLPLPPLLIGIIFEILYLFLLALAPLPELHLHNTPLINDSSWALALSHLLFPGAWTPAGNTPKGDWIYIISLAVTFLALAGLHLFMIRSRLEKEPSLSLRWLFLLLIGATIFGLTLMLQPALFSDDVFRYIVSGRMLTLYHVDPMTTAAAQFPHDPYLAWISQPGTVNVYGPLWLTFVSLLVRIGGTMVSMLLLFKGVALLFHLLNCVLLWAILGRIAPARRFVGTLLYAWNPLALIELAGNGHNEAVLICLLLLATWLHVQDKGRWYEIGALVVFALAMTINFIALLVVAMYIWFLVRRYSGMASVAWNVGWRILLVWAIVALIYIPYWHGVATYLALTSSMNLQPEMYSFLNTLATPLRQFYSFIVPGSKLYSSYIDPIAAANATVLSTAIFIFALTCFYLLGKVRKAPKTTSGMKYVSNADVEMKLPGFDVLLTSWCIAIVGYMVLVSGVFWPFFVLWALWIVALRQIDALSISILLLSYTALFIYPLMDFGNRTLAVYAPLLIFGLSLVYLLLSRKRRTERKRLFYAR
ncbi:MAG TPA: hypothetical protein VF043_19670 [Ktedonobacteraceae bacterium]